VKLLPPEVARLSAAEVLRIAYGGSPPAAATEEKPSLQLEILARRMEESEFAPLANGDPLASERDDYFLAVRPLAPGFLYIFQIDSTGKKAWLFPRNQTSPYSSGSNPVTASQVLQVPSAESNRVLYLDTTPGIEHVYAVFSTSRWRELEEALRLERSGNSSSAGGEEPAPAAGVRTPNGLQTRGVGGTRPMSPTPSGSFFIERTEAGHRHRLLVSSAPFQATGSFLVIERWFKHVGLD
jgi:hypothetical protein